ncbi:TolC family protein [Winogradskyella sp.]|uniref:TolC family protein n=1 Tax=Winogradskyella sp. TaxID=1883156 RepID=UPI00261F5D35|nr:TolC family protein [Winogradskyella sp.]
MRKNWLVAITMIGLWYSESQNTASLSLQEAYNLVEKNYPLIKDEALLNALSEYNIELINKDRLPTLTLNGFGQLQTENVQIGEPGSPVSVDAPLESYRAYIDANYNLYDGGFTKAKKQIEEAVLKVNQQGLKVTLRNLKDRINNLFFIIKLSRQQQVLLETSINDIDTNIESLQAGFDNGTVLESELSKLKVRKLELQSEDVRLQGDIKAYFGVINMLLGTRYAHTTTLTLPQEILVEETQQITRPEQQFYDFQKELLQAQESTIEASRKPKVSLFAQGGVGYPNPLNFSDISNATYALGGIRLNWDILDWGKAKQEREKLKIEIAQTEVDKETFEFDITSRKKEYLEKIEALQGQLFNDEKIVALQKDILNQTEVQLQEGIINSNDYLIQVNAELSARQQQELHRVQLQQLQIEYLTLYGKL